MVPRQVRHLGTKDVGGKIVTLRLVRVIDLLSYVLDYCAHTLQALPSMSDLVRGGVAKDAQVKCQSKAEEKDVGNKSGGRRLVRIWSLLLGEGSSAFTCQKNNMCQAII